MYQNFYCTLPNSLSLNQLLSIHTAYIKTIISTSNIHSIFIQITIFKFSIRSFDFRQINIQLC